MFAVVETGGKQYKVAKDDIIEIEKLNADEGEVVILDKVLMFDNGKEVKTGKPTVDGLKVSAEILQQKKSDKVLIFKKKRRHNYRRKIGHRQELSLVKILEIGNDVKASKPKKATEAKTEAKKETKVTESKAKKTTASKSTGTKKASTTSKKKSEAKS
jgi:large subunit ribosomal protein L21